MFSFHNLTDHFRQQQMPHGCPRRDFGPQYYRPFYDRRGPQGCRNNEFEQAMNQMCPAVLNFLHNLEERCKPKSESANIPHKSEGNCKNKKEGKKSEKSEKPCAAPENDSSAKGKRASNVTNESCPFECMLKDAFGNVVAVFNDARPAQKWRQKVDCRGFETKDIKVKIDEHALQIKAFRKEKNDHGMRTSSMRKRVPLPDNIDEKKVTCQLLPNGILIVEAPIVNKEKPANTNGNDFVNDLMTMIFPGIEQTHEDEDQTGEKSFEKEDAVGENNEIVHDGEEASIKREKTSEIPRTIPVNNMEDSQNTSTEEQEVVASQHNTENGENLSKDLRDEQDNIQNADNQNTDSTDEKSQQCEVHDIDDEDTVSNSSEDSFVLLSELGKENRDIGDSFPLSVSSTTTTDATSSVTDGESIVNHSQEDSKSETVQEGEKKEELLFNPMHDPQQARTTVPDQGMADGSQMTEEPFVFRLEMPSYNPGSIQVNFDESERALNIVASKDTPSNSGKTKTMAKSVPIPDNIDVDRLQCTYRDGMLSVSAPFKKTHRTIPVNI